MAKIHFLIVGMKLSHPFLMSKSRLYCAHLQVCLEKGSYSTGLTVTE